MSNKTTVGAATPMSLATRLEEEWLESQVRRGQRNPFGHFGRLTPGMAEILLSRNPGSRNISRHAVDRMVRDILAGAWAENGESIIVADTGELNDGQHRCAAVMEAGRAIRTAFWFGASRESRLTVDVGLTRSTKDFLEMIGAERSAIVAPCCNWLVQIERCGTVARSRGSMPTNQEQLRYWEDHPDLAASVAFVDRRSARRIGSRAVLATAHYLIAKADREEADRFFEKLIDGGATVYEAAHQAREALIDIQSGRSTRSRRSVAGRLEIIVRAWNCHRSGKDASRICVTGKIPQAR